MQIPTRLLITLLLLCLSLQVSAAAGVLERIKATKTVTITYDPGAYPISFKNDEGDPRGYSVDLCRRILASIEGDLGLDKIDIRWVEGDTPRRLAAVADGEADMECGATILDLRRQEQVDFSNIVLVESGGILVLENGGIEDLSDLAGKRVAVAPDSRTEKRLRAVLQERLIKVELVPVKDAKDGRRQMIAGEVDALAGDRLALAGQVAADEDAKRFSILDEVFSTDPYAFALARNQADFRLAVNRGLARIYRTGEIGRIFKRWFGEDTSPTRLMDAIVLIFGFRD